MHKQREIAQSLEEAKLKKAKKQVMKLIALQFVRKRHTKFDLHKQINLMNPTPEINIKKFDYFYKPYNYVCNTKKFITYHDEQVLNDGCAEPLTGWAQVHDFLLKSDFRVREFVLNQLRKISDKKTDAKRSKTREKRKENELKKNAVYEKLMQARNLQLQVSPLK